MKDIKNHATKIPSVENATEETQRTFSTIHERICRMTMQEMEELATGEALSIADSSRLEGLVLDQERIRTEILNGYLLIHSQTKYTN